MLKHADVWVLADQEEQAKEAPEQPKVEKEDESAVQDAKDSVSRMGKAAMLDYAKTNFAGVKINPNIGLENLRGKVLGLIDQFGVAK